MFLLMRFIEGGQTSYNNIGFSEQRGYHNRELVEGFDTTNDSAYNKIISGTALNYINDMSLNDLSEMLTSAVGSSNLPNTGTLSPDNVKAAIVFNTKLSEILDRLDASYNIVNLPTLNSQTTLKNEIKQLKDDIESAKLRKEAIEKQEEKTSYYQLFGGFARPLRTISIPVLISITVMLMFISIFSVFYVFRGSGSSGLNINSGSFGSSGYKNANNMFKKFGLKTL